VAPIGAVLGEWVGSSAGLGYLMLHANSRMQIDLLFAALLTLATLAVGLYFTVDAGLKWLLPWYSPNPENLDLD
jgi:putative hydroxymethylpyrimidine transport system permease protein